MHRIFRTLSTALCCLLFLFLAGCASKLPKTVSLPAQQEQSARALFNAFNQNPMPTTVESEYRMTWDIMGKKGGIALNLSMEQPEMLRISANDPLGRALILAMTDGERFRWADNRLAKVYEGKVNSAFWRAYAPDPLRVRDLFPLLGGRVSTAQPLTKIKAAANLERNGFWYVWEEDSFAHHVLLDAHKSLMLRHMLFNQDKELLLDLSYSNYQQDRETGYFWPTLVALSGSLVQGQIRLEQKSALSFDPLPASTFVLEVPAHFKVEPVQ